MVRKLIMTADDFGASAAVNAAVLRAHREGVLTSASLMVTGDAAGEAVALARATPSLAIGLHVALADARPALPAREVQTQFERFAATGLALAHVDGHHHLHLHPAVFPLVARLASRFGAQGIRLPWEGLRSF